MLVQLSKIALQQEKRFVLFQIQSLLEDASLWFVKNTEKVIIG